MLFKSMIWLSFFWLMASLWVGRSAPNPDAVPLLTPPEPSAYPGH